MIATIVVGVVAAVVAVAWFVLGRHPEQSASHDTAGNVSSTTETRSEQIYGGADRPAGPDAESMDPDAFGGDHRRPS